MGVVQEFPPILKIKKEVKLNCKHCGTEMQSRGVKDGVRSYYCPNCPKGQNWEYIKENGENVFPSSSPEKASFASDGENIFINYVSDHVPSTDEVAKLYDINLDEWEVRTFETTDWQMGRKDKKVDLSFNGGVMDGTVEDSGQINRVWLHRINVKFIRKTQEIRARNYVQELVEEIKKNAPIYPEIKYSVPKDGMLYEIDAPDIHFGRLAWNEETGKDYDIHVAENDVNKVFDQLLSYAKIFNISEILLPWGNDFFNVDSLENTTTHGTPQQEDTRWQKTFSRGCKLSRTIIDKCSQIAPVRVLIISGNHDTQRTFYLGEVLNAYYYNSKNVIIDNSPKVRKYHLFGTNLIGFAHGYNEKLDRLASMMANEVPELWAKAKHREMHTGDKHRKFDATEESGVVLRILRALTASDAWTYGKGFNSLRAAESFLWHPDNGLLAQFTAQP